MRIEDYLVQVNTVDLEEATIIKETKTKKIILYK